MRRRAIVAAALLAPLVGAVPATAIVTTRDLVKRETMTVAGCARPDTVRVNAPKGARDLKVVGPKVGAQLLDSDGRAIATIVGINVGKKGITWGALGSGLSCENPGYVGGGPRTSVATAFTLRYTLNEKVFMPRRCARGSYKPSFVTLDCTSRRLRLSRIRWTKWDQSTPTGTASLRTLRPGLPELRQNATLRASDPRRCGDRLVYRKLRVTVAGRAKTYTLRCRK